MRFIRKGGRVIPIRDDRGGSSHEQQKKKAVNVARAGAALAVGGATTAIVGSKIAGKARFKMGAHFNNAVKAAVKTGKGSGAYEIHKAAARIAAKGVVKGHRLMAAGGLLYAAGLGTFAAGATHHAMLTAKGKKRDGKSK